MPIIVFQHEANETIGRLGRVLQQHNHKLRVVRLFEGQSVPADLDNVHGIVGLGGDMNVDDSDKHPWMQAEVDYLKAAHEAMVPIVGICLGAQLVAHALGGEVAAMPADEAGWHEVRLAFPGTIDTIFSGMPWTTMQMHMHGQEVTRLPHGATGLAGSKMCKNQAFKVGLTTYAFQFHFEWQREHIEKLAQHQHLRNAGVSPEQLRQQTQQHYDAFARLGDRLCENLALYLMPIDRRVAVRA